MFDFFSFLAYSTVHGLKQFFYINTMWHIFLSANSVSCAINISQKCVSPNVSHFCDDMLHYNAI